MTEPREPYDENDLWDETDDETLIRRRGEHRPGGGVFDIDPWEIEKDVKEPDDDGELDDEEPDDPEDRFYGVTLEELAERPGQTGWLAKELLAIRAEREHKAALEAAAASSQAATEAGIGDFTEPAFLDGLRAQVEIDRRASDAAAIREYERSLRNDATGRRRWQHASLA